MTTLFTPLTLGKITLPNRIVMAPLTRMRCGPDGIPTDLVAEYYRQRATAGLVITEGTCISKQAQGYPGAPGIFTPEQRNAWRMIASENHAAGGRIAMQIAHNGRGAHRDFTGEAPIAPSAIPFGAKVFSPAFEPTDAPMPRALETDEVPALVASFRDAAVSAVEAGFDAVEIQAANGHLVDQFLQDASNVRTDRYGGSVPNRARFLLEIVDAVAAAVGPERVGVRVSPYGRYGGIGDSDPIALFSHVLAMLGDRSIAYVHMIEARGSEMGITDELHGDATNNAALFRRGFSGPFLSAAAYDPSTATEAVAAGHVDAVAFGRMFIANPDLVERIRRGSTLNLHDRATFYGGSARGYTDYPSLGL